MKYQDQKTLASPTNPANKGDGTSQETCSGPSGCYGNCWHVAPTLFFKTTTATAWHCESLQWHINLSQSANPAVFPQRFRADCNWALSSAAGCEIDKWPNSHLYQSAYADIAPNMCDDKATYNGTTLSSSDTETSLNDTAAFTLQPV